MTKIMLILASASGALAVSLGAFAAHFLKSRLEPGQLQVFDTAVQYHFYHTLALLATIGLCVWQPAISWFRGSAILFLMGIILFSGSLYLLALTGARWLGPITPVGGVCFLLGWLCILVGATGIDAGAGGR